MQHAADQHRKENGNRLYTKASLDTVWTIGCGVVTAGAVPS